MTACKGTPAQGLWGATLGFFFGFASVALFGPTAFRLQDAMHLSPLLVGLLVAAPSLSGSLLRIPFAAWVDVTGGRRPFLVLLCLSLLGMAGLWLLIATRYPAGMTPGLYPLLFVLGLLCGCGIATFTVGISQVAYWFPQSRQGWALGVYAGLGNLAPGLFSMLLPMALGALGLAGSYLVWLVFLALGTALYFLLGRNSFFFQLREQGLARAEAVSRARAMGQELFPAASLAESLGRSARNWKTWALVFLYFCTFGGFIGLTAWFPIYWHGYFGLGAVAAGLLTAAYSLLTSGIRVAGGVVADRVGGERTALLALLVTLGGAAGLVLSHHPGLSFAAALVMALGMGVNNAAVFKLAPQEVPEAVGGAAGWIGGLGAFGGFVLPPVLGALVRLWGNAGYARGFLAFAGLSVLGLGVAALLGRRRTPQPAQATPSEAPSRSFEPAS